MGEQYGQPYQQPPMQPQSAGAKWGPTSMGMESHIAAGLSYLFSPILPLVFFLIEKSNRFVKFHAMQSMILGFLGIAWFVVTFIIQGIIAAGSTAADAATNGGGLFSAGGGLLSCLVGCLYFVGVLGFFALFIWGLIAGFTGKYTKLPIVGGFAERWAGGPVAPMA